MLSNVQMGDAAIKKDWYLGAALVVE